jgi:predicted DNA-binding transcriptional regulator YafY
MALLRVDRIQALAPSGQTFERPEEFVLEPLYDDTWIMKQVGQGPRTQVRLSGTPGALSALCEHWYWRHCLRSFTGTEASFEIDPDGYAYLARYLLTMGAEIHVIEPAYLRDEVTEEAKRLIKHHKNEP